VVTGRFAAALAASGLAAVAEIKRRSPSAGDLRRDADPAAIAAAYSGAGAAAISVLVDERFAGSWADLAAARAATDVPLLAKGFFADEGDLETARRLGADAALLLLRDLDDDATRRLMEAAADLGLEILVEAHDAAELARAIALDAPVVGVNARDLDTFAIDRRRQLDLVASIPSGRVVVAESGIRTRADGAAAELAGADAILVGSTLMTSPDPAGALAELTARPLVKVCGLTRAEDVAVAADAGADLAGFVLVAESPRAVSAVLPTPEGMLSVAVWVGEAGTGASADLDQVHTSEPGLVRGRRADLLRDGRKVASFVDRAWGGDGTAHWAEAAVTPGRVVVAGGLDPGNVADAIDAVHPWAVDASSSLESEPGIKDPDRVEAFVAAVREAGR
jgi:indole-3-glycerol phosphate synthase